MSDEIQVAILKTLNAILASNMGIIAMNVDGFPPEKDTIDVLTRLLSYCNQVEAENIEIFKQLKTETP